MPFYNKSRVHCVLAFPLLFHPTYRYMSYIFYKKTACNRSIFKSLSFFVCFHILKVCLKFLFHCRISSHFFLFLLLKCIPKHMKSYIFDPFTTLAGPAEQVPSGMASPGSRRESSGHLWFDEFLV